MEDLNIEQIKKEYTEKINDRIKKYSNLIIDSFVEYYGEEYRKIITERFNNISFLYYINDFTIFYIVDCTKEGRIEEIKKYQKKNIKHYQKK